jgi:FtsZ-interacting cell division protein ZipA
MNIIQSPVESNHSGNYFSYGHTTTDMRGRWAMFAAGRAISNNRANAAQQQQQQQADQALLQQQREADLALQQKNQEIERLRAAQSQQAKSSQSPQEDVAQKIQKLGDLHQKGLLTDEEFSKLKMDLLSKL